MREKVWKKNGRVGAAAPREKRKKGGAAPFENNCF
jgi:hypothetical protein